MKHAIDLTRKLNTLLYIMTRVSPIDASMLGKKLIGDIESERDSQASLDELKTSNDSFSKVIAWVREAGRETSAVISETLRLNESLRRRRLINVLSLYH